VFAHSPPLASASVQHVADTVGRVIDTEPKRQPKGCWACGSVGERTLSRSTTSSVPRELFHWLAVLVASVTGYLNSPGGDRGRRWWGRVGNDITSVIVFVAIHGPYLRGRRRPSDSSP